MEHHHTPCAVSADLSRYLSDSEAGEQAADATADRRAHRVIEILTTPRLLLEACVEYADADAILLQLLNKHVGRSDEASGLLYAAAEAMAAHEIKELTPGDLRRERADSRADMRADGEGGR